MQIRLLGPVDVAVDGQVLAVSGLRRKALVAALALQAGAMVSTDWLIDVIWGDRPPAGVIQTLQSHVSQMRRFLGPGVAIRFTPPGYVLELPADGTDVAVAHRLIRDAAATGDPEEGARLLRQAIGMWRGQALSELAEQPWFDDQARWLDSLLAQARRALAEHRLALGEHTALVPELRAQARELPLDEDVHRQLMLAMYRSGQQAAALATYRELRDRLVTELGIQPAQQLRGLEQAILRQDAQIAWTPPLSGLRVVDPAPVPRQLPLAIPAFTGRVRELSRLDTLLAVPSSGQAGAGDSAPRIAVLSGMAGVGKTATAVHWAHRVADRFPDGQLHVNLRGFGPHQVMPTRPDEALRILLEALGVEGGRIPVGVDERAALYRSRLAGRRVLIVLDNARDAGQVRPLLPAAPTAAVVITSRNRLPGLAVTEGAVLLTLDVMTVQDARRLLTSRLCARADDEPAAVTDLIHGCGRLPLALAIVAAQAAAEPELALSQIAAELRDAQNTLSALQLDDDMADVRRVFSWSYRALTPSTARLFRLLALHPGPEVTGPAAASVAASSRPEARRSLLELSRASLISEHAPGRYQSHDLLRVFAGELARDAESAEQREACVLRIIDHYTHSAHTAALLLGPLMNSRPPPPPATEPILPEEPADDQAAWAWFVAEQDVLLATTRKAAARQLDHHTWHLTMSQEVPLLRSGRWPEQGEICELAVAAARRLGDPGRLAAALRLLSRVRSRLGHEDQADAYAHAREALHLYEQLHDMNGAAMTLMQLGSIDDQLNQHHDAIRHTRAAFDLYQQAGNAIGQAHAVNCIGWHRAHLGEFDQALQFCRQALPALQEAGDRESEAGVWDSIGYAQHHLRRYNEARDSYRRALGLARLAGDVFLEAEILTHLADTDHITGEHEAARQAWRQAQALYERLGHPHADAIGLRLHPDPGLSPPAAI